MSSFSRPVALGLLCILALCLLGMTGRVAYLQTVAREQTLHWAERQQYQDELLPARRGSIFSSNLFAMAATVQRKRIFVDPKFLKDAFEGEVKHPGDKTALLRKLAEILDRDPADLTKLLSEHADARYLILAEEVEGHAVDEIQKLNIPGIGTEPTSKRLYPMGSMAAHLLGSVGKDDVGRGQRGLEGIELRFNSLLAGSDGHQRTIKNARRYKIGLAEEDYLPPKHGQHLILTVDANIQLIAEEELAATCTEFKAQRGEVIVMDPRTGDLLAMACWPPFNPQNLDDSTPDLRRNRCLTDPGEFGSVIKPFIAGPALMWKITEPAEMWNTPVTFYTSYGRKISDVHGYGKLALWDVLVKSSNVGMAQLGERMGNAKLYKALTMFGFGKPTGIDLPGESGGRVNPLAKWTHYSTDSVAYGYELMVTPMQLTRSFCAYANGGRLVSVRLKKGVLDTEGNVIENAGTPKLESMPRVIDQATADDVRRILADVPVRGTATKARSRFWNIFGKTGTAHITVGGSYAQKYNASFICGAPYENPRLVVGLFIHEPDQANHYGGGVAGPGGGLILERSLAYLGVPQSPDLPLPPPKVASVLYGYNAQLYRKPPEPRDGGRAGVTPG